MRHGSLFSGIGGFDLASEWMDWENIFHCEIENFPSRVLKYYWPNAISYEDIKKTDFTIHRGQIDILTGGFPCQPYSLAGKRQGKNDERHLWPEMLRAIKEIQPRWIVGENVFGLINWNGGLVFDEVQADLEAQGYEVWAYVLPAASVNAPHKRYRVWFVAYSDHNRHQTRSKKTSKKNRIQKVSRQEMESRQFNRTSISSITTNTDGCGWVQNNKKQQTRQFKQNDSNWKNFPTQAPICDGDDGLSARLDSITFPKWRSESVKGGGNAIVPQVALQIFKAIQHYEKTIKNDN